MAPRWTNDALDAELARRVAAQARIADALVELERHPGHRLLAATALTGTSAQRWAHVRELLPRLWADLAVHRTTVAAACAVRTRRARPGEGEWAELRTLLVEPSIEVDRTAVALRDRGIDGASVDVRTGTLGELAERMDQRFREVVGVLETAETVHLTALAALGPLAERLRAARSRATALLDPADPDTAALTDLATAVDTRVAACTHDPLAHAGRPPRDLAADLSADIDAALAAVEARLAALSAVCDAWPQQRAEAAAAVAALDDLWLREGRARRDACEVVADTGLTAPPDPRPALQRRLAALPGPAARPGADGPRGAAPAGRRRGGRRRRPARRDRTGHRADRPARRAPRAVRGVPGQGRAARGRGGSRGPGPGASGCGRCSTTDRRTCVRSPRRWSPTSNGSAPPAAERPGGTLQRMPGQGGRDDEHDREPGGHGVRVAGLRRRAGGRRVLRHLRAGRVAAGSDGTAGPTSVTPAVLRGDPGTVVVRGRHRAARTGARDVDRAHRPARRTVRLPGVRSGDGASAPGTSPRAARATAPAAGTAPPAAHRRAPAHRARPPRRTGLPLERADLDRPHRLAGAALRAGRRDPAGAPHRPAQRAAADPQVPEHDRFCRHGGTPHPVGRTRDGRPSQLRGFCPQDGDAVLVRPAAVRRNARRRPVRGAGRARPRRPRAGSTSRSTATSTTAGSCSRASSTPTTPPRSRRPGAERQFLAQLSHPGIVAIHNFVRHVDGDGAEADYIVMAYIGGSTLSQVMAQPGDRRRAARRPRPHAA